MGFRKLQRQQLLAPAQYWAARLNTQSRPLPFSHPSRNDAEQRMRLRHFDLPPLTVQLRRPHSQLGLQVAPFIEQLSLRLRYTPVEPPSRNLAGVKMIATTLSLVCQSGEERGNGSQRLGLRLKTGK